MIDAPRLAAALHAQIAGSFVQDVRLGGEDLVVLSLRHPGASHHVGFSALATAPGVLLLADGTASHRGDGLTTAARDLLRATVIGARVVSVASASRDGQPLIRMDAARGDETTSLVLDLGGRGNLEIHRPGHAAHALRPPPGELPDAAPTSDPPDAATARDLLLAETARAEAARARVLHGRRLTELRQRLRRSTASARTLVQRRQEDVARLGDPARLRDEADALAAHLHELARGQSALEVADWRGAPLRLQLDPAESAAENLRRAYTRAAKAERGVLEARSRLEEAELRATALAALDERARDTSLDAISAADDVEALDAAASELLRPERGKPAAARPSRKEAEARRGPREHRSHDGLRILVGRSARGNDELTFRVARGNDVWLHARGAAGAHVVLVLPKGAEIPPESLLDAATLAHRNSRVRDEPRGEITWCRAKDVSRRRGAPPGEVTVTRERVIGLRVEPERVARLESGES